MKKILALLIVSATVLCSCSRFEENEFGTSWAEDNLKGKVQSVKLTIHDVTKKFGELKPGSITEEVYKHPLSSAYTYSQLHFDYYKKSICKRTYNEDGMILSDKWYNKDKELCYETTNKYKEGQLTETITEITYHFRYSSLPKSILRSVYSYDSATGKVKEEVVYNDTALYMTRTFEYADNEETCRYKTGYTVTHFENRMPVDRISFDSIGNETGTTKYNKHGLVTSYNSTKSREYKYNEFNDPISLTEDIDSYTFTYEYDKKKNWTKRITYKDDEPIYIEVREITYFE